MMGIVHTILVLLILIGLNEAVRKSKWIAIAFYVALPIALTPLFIANATAPGSSVNSWFDWVKLYSVLFACLWYTGLNYTSLGTKNWAKFVAMAILAINIGEAVARDMELFFQGDHIGMFAPEQIVGGVKGNGSYQYYHLMNAVAGVLSIITLSGWNGMRVEGDKARDFLWPDLRLLWIIAYDVWNFAYIYNCVPWHAAFGFVVLSACTIPSLLIKKGTWLQARAYTLAGWMMYIMAATTFIDAPGHYVALPYDPLALYAVSGLSLLLNAWFAVLHFGRTAQLKGRGFGEPVYAKAL